MLAGQAFQHAKVEQWSQLIVENVLKDVAANNDDAAKTVNGKFKYIGAPKLSSCSLGRMPVMDLMRVFKDPTVDEAELESVSTAPYVS